MMDRDESSQGSAVDRFESLQALRAAAAAAGPEALQQALQRLLASGADAVDPFAPTPMPSRRRPRRSDVVTYRVRIDLRGTKPPVWRRLELASDLLLDEVHDIVQVAFGWTDSHLHRFGSGPEFYGDETEYYLCPWDVDEGDDGVPEREVRLDEVLVDVGDRLFYNYDYGDDWQHALRLESVEDRTDGAPRAVCVTGRRPGPPEDCGGVHGFELIAAALDRTRPDHAEAIADFASFYGEEVDPDMFDLTPFDVDEVNEALAGLGINTPSPVDLPRPLADLLDAVSFAPDRQWLRQLIAEAGLDGPVQVDAAVAARMVGPYTWLLDRVGTDGIKLTAAGYLPPVHVAAAVDELGLGDEWIGKGNRENQTMPVLHLRESARRTGLLRTYRGRVVLTARGRTARTDPVALWWRLAERMPLRSTDTAEAQAGLIVLLAVAAEATDDLEATVARLLGAIGWTAVDGTPLTEMQAARAAWDTRAVLRRLGAVTDGWRNPRLTAGGVAFARAALVAWPV